MGLGFARFAYGLMLPAMREDLAWTYTEAGWINTSNAIGYLVGALLALKFISGVGARHLFIGGVIMTAVSLFASGMTRDFELLTLWRVLAGLGGALAYVGGATMAAALFKGDASRNARAIAVYVCGGGGFGMLLSGLAIPLMLQAMGVTAWPQTWLLLGAMSMAATVPSAIAAAGISATSSSTAQPGREPLPIRAMAAALIGYFLFGVGYIVYVTFLVAWMRTQNADAPLIALTWSVLGLAAMVSPFPWQKVLAVCNGGTPLALSCGAVGFGTLLPMFVGGPFGLSLSAAVFGLSGFIAPTATTSFIRKNLPESQWGRSVAFFTAIFAVGQMIGPVAAGWVADQFASISLGLVAGGLTLLLAACASVMQRPLKPEAEND
jgi:MFS family permease